MAKMYGKATVESEEQQKRRWQIELEFVQCLSNPNYLNFLAQRGYFKDQSFINYLKYLQYWKEPDYAKYLMYPMCLYFLDLLQYEHFRREIVNSQCCKFIDDQAILQWQHYTRKRIKLMENAAAAQQQQQQQQQQQLQQSNGGEAATAGEAAATGGMMATANGNGTASAAEAQPLGGSVQRGEPGQAQAVIPQQQQQQINGLATASNIKLELN
ncbi:mediator of RNA polymerase II transcription subunit 31 isoform X2 [Drosophila pseudoobscura]|uniref:Mediator of RNA polymerase II transcription subunit 31 n=1 Tax=Drosophila pseudoobscura pseudoobscura TaxID=46245 RepID=A0A6I8W4R2_DROPS|nr:mediator of RNA polymerase II transcription subunit 31 isoform X2 [Drosophila pseudoobscura]